MLFSQLLSEPAVRGNNGGLRLSRDVEEGSKNNNLQRDRSHERLSKLRKKCQGKNKATLGLSTLL